MKLNGIGEIPVTDDHIHFDLEHGFGLKAVADFRNSGGTHMFLVSLPSWTHGITPACGEDYRPVFETTIRTARIIHEKYGITVFPIVGVHPVELTKFMNIHTLSEMEEIMKGGLDIAAEYVESGEAVALKSGRPHFETSPEILETSNRILSHALMLAHDCSCALQIHAETGPCADVAPMAEKAGISPKRVVKHFACGSTPLSPSYIAKYEGIADAAKRGEFFTMETDYMDEPERPGAVIGPKSVARFTRKYIESGDMTVDDAYRIHKETPEKVYGVEIEL